MPLTNLNNQHLDAAAKAKLDVASTELLNLVEPYARNLTPAERQQYGSIAEQNKLAVIKVLDYETSQPDLRAPAVNYTELRADWEDRSFLATLAARLERVLNVVNNIRITHDWDVYQSAKADYEYARYMAGTEGGAAWEQKYQDLLQFYKTGGGRPAAKEQKDDVKLP